MRIKLSQRNVKLTYEGMPGSSPLVVLRMFSDPAETYSLSNMKAIYEFY
jgi:hypothetical protein